MDPNKDNTEKIRELQLIDQNLQSLSLQKQAFQMEINESENALSELNKKDNDEVFKVIGSIMIKSDKKNIIEDLDKKLNLLNLRMKTMEKQEKEFTEKAENLREEITKEMQTEKSK